jgi:hypothetical protein
VTWLLRAGSRLVVIRTTVHVGGALDADQLLHRISLAPDTPCSMPPVALGVLSFVRMRLRGPRLQRSLTAFLGLAIVVVSLVLQVRLDPDDPKYSIGSGVAVTLPAPPLGSYLSALLPRLHAGSGLRSVLLCRGTEARRFRWNGR